MFPEERRERILYILNGHGRCLVSDLARDLSVSEVTIRQDLDLLEQRGLLRRTHGGAILTSKIGFERPFQVQEASFHEEKERIGKAAAELIADGDTVILDVGTTVTELARHINGKQGLTILTNALNIALLLEDNPGNTVIVTGGTLRPIQHSLVSPYGSLILERVHADIAFFGVNGIEANHGVTNVNIAEAEMKGLFLKAARRRVVLADSSKIGNIALAKFADINEIDWLITDDQADPEAVEKLRQKGLQVNLV